MHKTYGSGQLGKTTKNLRKVGITQNELNIDFMDQKALKKVETRTCSTTDKEKTNLVIESSLNIRHGSAEYW